MPSRNGKVHIATTRRQYKGKTYEAHLLRRTYRENGKVKNQTVGNVSHLPAESIDLLRRHLAGEQFFSSSNDLVLERSRAHGNVVSVLGTLRQLGLEQLIDGTRSRQRDLVIGMIAARLLKPDSKLATTRSWDDCTLASALDIADADENETYAAMDWLLERQARIEKKLAARHLENDALVLYDLSSSYMEGTHCPLAHRGYSRDGRRGTLQIEYGMVTDGEGRPIAVEVVPGNTGDPATVAAQVEKLTKRFKLSRVVLVGDRGMLTSAQIETLRQRGLDWISSLRSPQIRELMNCGVLQMTLFDTRNLAEISHPDYPGERLVVCLNPALAEERARTREDLLKATEALLQPVIDAVVAGRLRGADKIGLRVGRLRNKYKVGKHFELSITDDSLTVARRQAEIKAEAALDGIYVVRTSVPADRLPMNDVVRSYKLLEQVERVFRAFKSVDLQVRPIRHRLEDRVRAHILICMLAYYVRWHLERAWAPLLFRDEARPHQDDPVAPAERSAAATRKARTRTIDDGTLTHSFRSLMGHMATLTRGQMRLRNGGDSNFTLDATPTPLQQRALALLKLNTSSL